MPIITTLDKFVAVHEAISTTYSGFYRRELVGATLDVSVDAAKYDPKTGAIEFRCTVSTVDEVLRNTPLKVTIHKGGALSAAADKDGSVYLEANPAVSAELQQLIATINKRPAAAAAPAHVLEHATPSENAPWASSDQLPADGFKHMLNSAISTFYSTVTQALADAGFEVVRQPHHDEVSGAYFAGEYIRTKYKGKAVLLEVGAEGDYVAPHSEEMDLPPVKCASIPQLVQYIDQHAQAA